MRSPLAGSRSGAVGTVELLRRRRGSGRLPGLVGTARLDRRTVHLTRRIGPGEIAVLDHVDLDRASADALVSRRVAAVVNASPSISGRYPNLGPEVLLGAGIPLLDVAGDDVFRLVREGEIVRLDGDVLHIGERVVARGVLQDEQTVGLAMAAARSGLVRQLEAFAADTVEHLLTERDLLLDGVGFPDLRTDLEGRHAVIVVRGNDSREDLRALRPYVREHHPVLIGVDGGADALCEAGLTPDLIVGDVDAVSDEALRCGAEVVVHAHPDGRAPGLSRVQDLGVPAVTFPAAGTSEDVAMLLADEGGAQLIVAVGAHATLLELLDTGRHAMASTVLTRLRVGSKLVDAEAVRHLHRSRISTWSLVALVLAALVVMAVALHVTSVGQAAGPLLTEALVSFRSWVGGPG